MYFSRVLVPALKQSDVDSVPSCPKVAGLVATESEQWCQVLGQVICSVSYQDVHSLIIFTQLSIHSLPGQEPGHCILCD